MQHPQSTVQCIQCDSLATVRCNGQCNACFCKHDRSTHATAELAQHPRFAIAQPKDSNVAPLSGSDNSNNNKRSSSSGDSSSSGSSAVAASASARVAVRIATIGESALNDVRLVAQRDEQGRAHGFGCEVDAAGKMIDDRCGVWTHGLLLEHRSVPLSLMPKDLFAEERVRGALLLRPNGEWYRGEVDAEHRPRGEGRLMSRNGTISEGQWSANELVSGQRTPPDSSCEQGSFVDPELHGPRCIVVWPNRDRYEGEMDRGSKAGVGKLTWFKSGDTYEGQFSKGVRSGFGLQRASDGAILQCGEWAQDRLIRTCPVPRSALPANSLPHPDDILLFPDGRVYRGLLNDASEPHGLGRLRYPNGSVFEGEFARSNREGLGVMWNAEGQLIQCGEWGGGWMFELDSRPVPRRLIPFGEKLTAAAREASLFYPSGEYFVGPLNAQDQPHGEGTMYSPHGSVKQQGLWSNGRFVAPAPPAPVVSDSIQAASQSAVGGPVPPVSSAAEAAPPLLPTAPLPPLAPVDAPVLMDVNSRPFAASSPQSAEAGLGAEITAVSSKPLPVRLRRRSALCIGNNNYAQPGPQWLHWCWSDAERMHHAMQHLHFDSSIVRTDLDFSSMNRELDSFISALVQQQYGDGDLALLYYSGHGCEIGANHVYLFPTDIGEADANRAALSMQMIKRRFNRDLRGVQVVIIADCCRGQETVDADARRRYTPSSSSAPQEPDPAACHPDDLARNDFGILYSCDSGHSSFPDRTGGSAFTSLLLEQLLAPAADLSLIGLFERANKQMLADTNDGQYQNAAVDISTAESITLGPTKSE